MSNWVGRGGEYSNSLANCSHIHFLLQGVLPMFSQSLQGFDQPNEIPKIL